MNAEDKNTILVGCSEGTVINFDYDKMKIVDEYKLVEDNVFIKHFFTFQNDKVITSENGKKYSLRIWKLKENSNNPFTYQIKNEPTDYISSILPLTNTQIAMTENNTGTFSIFNPEEENNRFKMCFEGVAGPLSKIKNKLLIGLDNSQLAVFDSKSIKYRIQIIKPFFEFVSLGKLEINSGLMSSGNGSQILHFSMDEGFKVINRYDKIMTCANLSYEFRELKDGRIINSDDNFEIGILDLKSSEYSIQFKGHTAQVLNFHQIDDFCFISASLDMTIRKWDLRKTDTEVEIFKNDKHHLYMKKL